MSGDGKVETLLDVPGSIQAHDVEHERDAAKPPATRFPHIPAFYGLYFVAMTKTARECGYALGLHGSMQRDCDIIAVPWTDEAVSADDLIARFVERHGLVKQSTGCPAVKPHGRLAYSLMMGGHFYFDVSVMPRTTGGTP